MRSFTPAGAAFALLFCLASSAPASAQIGEELELRAQHDSLDQRQREIRRHREEMERHREEMERHARAMHEALMRAYTDSAGGESMFWRERPDSMGRYFYSAAVGRSCARIGISFSADDSIVVRDVMEGSGADEAGLRVGDVLVSVNGETADADAMAELSHDLEPGDRVRFTVLRDGRTQNVDVTAREDVCPLRTMVSPRPFRVFCAPGDSVDDDDDGCTREFTMHLRESLEGFEKSMEEFERVPFSVFLQQGDSGSWVRFHGPDVDDSLFIDLDSVRVSADVIRLQLDSLRRVLPIMIDSMHMMMPAIEMGMREAEDAMAAHGVMLRSMRLGSRALAGAHLTELNDDLAEYFEAREGVLVTRVEDGTPAARAGLRGGDVIVEVNGVDVDDLDDVRQRATTADRPLDLTVMRRGERRTIRIAD